MKTVIGILILLLIYLQYRLWFAEGGMRDVWRLQAEIAEQRVLIEDLQERNETLEAEVIDLKQGLAAIEERARTELGMIQEGESFFRILKPPSDSVDTQATSQK